MAGETSMKPPQIATNPLEEGLTVLPFLPKSTQIHLPNPRFPEPLDIR